MCINCMCCYAACPQYGLDPSFIGPAALALAHRYNLDSRDQGKSQRLDILADHDGVWDCSFVGACSEVCPKSVDPAAAIQQMLLKDVQRLFVHAQDPAQIIGILSLSDAARIRSGSCRACTPSRLMK